MSFITIMDDVKIEENAWTPAAQHLLSVEFLQSLKIAHREFNQRRQDLLADRNSCYRRYDLGQLPSYLEQDSQIAGGNWRVAEIPEDLQTRRVEITGPVNDRKMVINMLSRNEKNVRADMAMLDFEDSMKPTWSNVIDGVYNVRGASRGELEYLKKDSQGNILKRYQLNPQDSAGVMIRVRGLHLNESHIFIDDQPISAGLFDFLVCLFYTADNFLARGKTPKFYVPKVEHHLEARWWNNLFGFGQNVCGLKKGTLRATFLIETLPAAFQIEEILYEIREHAAGLNVGRWDKIFSDIKVLKKYKDRITSDRAAINMGNYWMDNYAKRLIKICHERGAYAIGGMSAFTPGGNEETRTLQTKKVLEDKSNEFKIGHDGCWVSHPYFITPALTCFPQPHQLCRKLEEFDRYPDLIMGDMEKPTLQGLRTNIRVGIAYLQGWNSGLGCVAWDGLMEDLATLEISRAQVWQWLHHGATLAEEIIVTNDLVATIFKEELEKIVAEIKAPPVPAGEIKAAFCHAAEEAKKLFLEAELRPFLTCDSPKTSAGI